VKTNTPTPELLHKMDAYWRAANYLSVGQIYLYDNPLLKEPLKVSHVKPLVVGHRGTTPGQNFIYVPLNRVIKKYDLDMFYVAGPGHGGLAIVGNVYLEGTWSEIYPNVTQDETGLKKLFKQFSFPGGISSHVAPTTPGSIHEGGELGYSLSHAFGAAFDNPELIVACVWALAFSFARAIQQPALEIWRGQDAQVSAAHQALYHRARCNQDARRGEYSAAMDAAGEDRRKRT
jgi:xylulose-5-phosphate/fructose-6-phosphate phosphoketolase